MSSSSFLVKMCFEIESLKLFLMFSSSLLSLVSPDSFRADIASPSRFQSRSSVDSLSSMYPR